MRPRFAGGDHVKLLRGFFESTIRCVLVHPGPDRSLPKARRSAPAIGPWPKPAHPSRWAPELRGVSWYRGRSPQRVFGRFRRMGTPDPHADSFGAASTISAMAGPGEMADRSPEVTWPAAGAALAADPVARQDELPRVDAAGERGWTRARRRAGPGGWRAAICLRAIPEVGKPWITSLRDVSCCQRSRDFAVGAARNLGEHHDRCAAAAGQACLRAAGPGQQRWPPLQASAHQWQVVYASDTEKTSGRNATDRGRASSHKGAGSLGATHLLV